MFKTNRQLLIGFMLIALMALTRGSHFGDAALLPDATLACMLLGGVFLQMGIWFAFIMVWVVAVDAFAIGVADVSSYCLSPAYWALLPTYAVMWLGGNWLAKRDDAFEIIPYTTVTIATTAIAFLISTDSFYLFSGHFSKASLWEVMQHGWEYFPAYFGYTMMYLGLAWGVQRVFSMFSPPQATHCL